MAGNALVMKITCSGGDGCRCRTWSHEKIHMRYLDEPSGNLRGSITDASPIIWRCIGEYSGTNRRYIG